MGTLRGRVGLALVLFACVTLVSVGGALWVVLRDLHRDAGTAALAELVLPYVAQARERFVPGSLPGRPDGGGPGIAQRLIDARQFVQAAQQEIAQAGVSLLLARTDGGLVLIEPDGTVGTGQMVADVPIPIARGQVNRGSLDVAGMGSVLYASTPIFAGRLAADIDGLVLLRPDDSAQLATDDLLRALAIAALIVLAVGVPLAAWLARSMARPLERLAGAADKVARGETAVALPPGGPREVAHASLAFNAMAEEVGRSRERQRQLLADLRHDLRTPLTVISGFAEALRDGTASGPSADKAADAIADEARRLEHMLNSLGDLADLDPDGPPLRPEQLDACTVARDTRERFVGQAAARGQDIEAAMPPRALRVIADRGALERILANLVANALQHAPSPGGRIELQVTAVGASDPPIGGPGGWAGRPGVLLAVRDDGPGIPAAALPHVFDRLYRADPARSGPGAGLGLAIVASLAHAMAGRAFAENAAGGGARVGVVLPMAAGTSGRA